MPAATRRRAVLDVAVQIGGRAFNLVLGIVATAVVARALGERGFGTWSTLLVVAQMADYLADLGVESVAVSRAAKESEREAEWVGAAVAIRSLLSIPATLVAAVAVVLIASTGDQLAAGLLLAATILGTGPSAARALLQLRVRNDLNILVVTFNSVMWTGAAIALADADAELVAFAAVFAAISWATAALQVALALRAGRIRISASRPLLRPLAAAGIPVAIGGLLILAYARIDQILVYEIAGAAEAGLYAAAYRVLEAAHFIPLAVTTTLLPLVAAAHSTDLPRTRRMVQTAFDYLALASLPALGLALAASEPIVRLLFGDAFADAGPALTVLMGAYVLICFGYLSGNLVLVLGLQRRFAGYALLALVFNVGLNLALVPPYGFMAAAWITLGTEVLVIGLTWRMVMREIDYVPRLDRFVRSALAAAGMAAAVYGVRQLGAGAVVLIVVAGAVFSMLAFALRALRPDELRALVAARGAQAG
jgi:O-antigen/teichoic acid export membrane protein